MLFVFPVKICAFGVFENHIRQTMFLMVALITRHAEHPLGSRAPRALPPVSESSLTTD